MGSEVAISVVSAAGSVVGSSVGSDATVISDLSAGGSSLSLAVTDSVGGVVGVSLDAIAVEKEMQNATKMITGLMALRCVRSFFAAAYFLRSFATIWVALDLIILADP